MYSYLIYLKYTHIFSLLHWNDIRLNMKIYNCRIIFYYFHNYIKYVEFFIYIYQLAECSSSNETSDHFEKKLT